jgi:hypothetical protein
MNASARALEYIQKDYQSVSAQWLKAAYWHWLTVTNAKITGITAEIYTGYHYPGRQKVYEWYLRVHAIPALNRNLAERLGVELWVLADQAVMQQRSPEYPPEGGFGRDSDDTFGPPYTGDQSLW